MNRNIWIPIFFGIAACSWMPHWSCHYYRIETNSSFVVGSVSFTIIGSILSMLFYSVLIAMNLLSISFTKIRFASALTTGIFHLTLGFVHIMRFLNPYNFVVFGYEWTMGSSLREILMIFPFGILCIGVAIICFRSDEVVSD